MTIVYFFCVVVMGFHLCRQVIAKALLPEPDTIEFASDVFSVGETLFAIRHGGETASKTIVCFLGFTETISYFVDLYMHSPNGQFRITIRPGSLKTTGNKKPQA